MGKIFPNDCKYIYTYIYIYIYIYMYIYKYIYPLIIWVFSLVVDVASLYTWKMYFWFQFMYS